MPRDQQRFTALRAHAEPIVLAYIEQSRTVVAGQVAAEIVNTFPHSSQFTVIENEAAYGGVVQVVRDLLRHRHDADYDPVRIVQQDIEFEGSLLNDAYSIRYAGDDGAEAEYAYVARVDMTFADVQYVFRRYKKMASFFDRAADALLADWHRRNSPQA